MPTASVCRAFFSRQPNGYFLGSYRIATAPERNSQPPSSAQKGIRRSLTARTHQPERRWHRLRRRHPLCRRRPRRGSGAGACFSGLHGPSPSPGGLADGLRRDHRGHRIQRCVLDSALRDSRGPGPFVDCGNAPPPSAFPCSIAKPANSSMQQFLRRCPRVHLVLPLRCKDLCRAYRAPQARSRSLPRRSRLGRRNRSARTHDSSRRAVHQRMR